MAVSEFDMRCRCNGFGRESRSDGWSGLRKGPMQVAGLARLQKVRDDK